MLIQEVEKFKSNVKISEVIFDAEIYARIESNNKIINEYTENIEQILASDNLIQISKNNKLIDGFHRLKAAERVYGSDFTIPVLVHNTENRDYIELVSYSANTRHGNRNSKEENKRNVQRLFARGFTLEQIQQATGLGKSVVYDATTSDRKRIKEEQDKKILSMWLRCFTQDKIAEAMDMPQRTIADKIKNFSENSQTGKTANTTQPLLYNIWNLKSQDNETKHFGAFPELFMTNLLEYHTNPFDIVFDPFSGGGTTVDVCKKILRRYFCCDLKVTPGYEQDIRQHDITTGLSDTLPKPDFAFLDPPYWKQAFEKYSKSQNDLGNMDLEDFNNAMSNILNALAKRKVEKIAIVIQPTQYSNNFEFVDHIFDFHLMLQPKYKIESRYILPYSTQQYNAQMVEKAKKEKKCLTLNRDLVVWRLNG